MNKELSALLRAGRGRSAIDLIHPEFGFGIWAFESPKCNIAIFERGLLYSVGQRGQKIDLAFDEILQVESCLTVPALSEASRRSDFDLSLPLKLTTQGGAITLVLPVVIYSAVMITIKEMLRH